MRLANRRLIIIIRIRLPFLSCFRASDIIFSRMLLKMMGKKWHFLRNYRAFVRAAWHLGRTCRQFLWRYISQVVTYIVILRLGMHGRMNYLSKDCYAPAILNGRGHRVSPVSLRMSVLSVRPIQIWFPFIMF